jgi:hypothetical protein
MRTNWLIAVCAAGALVVSPALSAPSAPEPASPPASEAPAEPAPGPELEPSNREVAAPEAEGEAGGGAEETVAAAPPENLEHLSLEEAEKTETGEQLAQGAPPPTDERTPPPGHDLSGPAPTPRFTFGGQADFYYGLNLNRPFDRTNGLRAFDVRDRSPRLGLLELWGEVARDPIGFRMDLNYGQTARINASSEASDSLRSWTQFFQQLYVSANLSRDGRTYIDFGKWVTPHGAEVIEPVDNWFYSQGVVFTWPIPFWHFGARLYHYLNDEDYVMVHVNRGWGTIGNPGYDPNFGLNGSKTFGQNLTVAANYLGGDNIDALGRRGYRHLFNSVLSFTTSPESPLSYIVDMSLGNQSGGTWYGIQGMTRYQLPNNQSVAFRLEYLRDQQGSLFAAPLELYTASVNYTKVFTPNVQARLEYRHDIAGGGEPFSGRMPGSTRGSQGTFLLSTILSF